MAPWDGAEPWAALRFVVAVLLAYAFTVGALRWAGNRTLSKLRAFDLVATVALGSLLASAATSTSWVPWRALGGIGLILGLQTAVAWLGVRSRAWRALITAPPVLLFHDGAFQRRAMHRARVTEEEILMAMRQAGQGDPARVKAVILEPNGDVAVFAADATETLRTVPGARSRGRG